MDKGWNWDNVTEPFWTEPSEDVYYLLHRWKEAGRGRVLDLGCGMGRHSLLFAANGFQVTALDSAESFPPLTSWLAVIARHHQRLLAGVLRPEPEGSAGAVADGPAERKTLDKRDGLC